MYSLYVQVGISLVGLGSRFVTSFHTSKSYPIPLYQNVGNILSLLGISIITHLCIYVILLKEYKEVTYEIK